MPAGGPYELKIFGDSSAINIKDDNAYEAAYQKYLVDLEVWIAELPP
jgi:hypothetical protein